MAVTWTTPQGDLGTYPERIIANITLAATSSVGPITYSVIAGKLPAGLRLMGNTIKGSPVEVKKFTVSRFVIRASDGVDIKDRTFSISVDGADAPSWITDGGYLQVGRGSAYFVLDNSYVDFQLSATDTDLTAGDILEYYLMPMGGQLPPGLTLSKDGLISGYTAPIFAVDYNASLNGGYDTGAFDQTPIDFVEVRANGYDDYYYDNVTFDYSEPAQTPKKLSRSYSFVVAVTDGSSVVSRSFKIYVVTEEFLKSDNSIVQVGTNVFTADSSADRVPLWITPTHLGRFRANNYITLFLDVYDPPSLEGTITYFLSPTNPGTYRLKSTGELITDGKYELSGIFPEFAYNLKGTWNSTVTYAVGDAVRYSIDGSSNPQLFVCQTAHTNRIPEVGVYWNQELSENTQRFTPVNSTLWDTIESETTSVPPPGLEVDSTTGELAGNVPYQSKISKQYKFTVVAVNFPNTLSDVTYTLRGDWNSSEAYQVNDAVRYSGFIYICISANRNALPTNTNFWIIGVSSDARTFTVEIIGEIESAINWVTDTDLGTIKPNQPSRLFVEAATQLYGNRVSYSLVSGELPSGLEFLSDGTIQGKIKQFADSDGPGLIRFFDVIDSLISYNTTWDGGTTSFDKKFTFTIEASDSIEFSKTNKEFFFTVVSENDKTFSNLYIKAFQSKTKRLEWNTFITDSTIFVPTDIYRFGDTNFGVQSELKLLVYAGIESTEAVKYVQAMSRNHYRKQILFGDIKVAKAKDPTTQETIYEVVYVDVVDDLEKNEVSISRTVNLPDKIESKVIISYDSIKVDSDIPFASDADHQRIFPNSIKNMRRQMRDVGDRDREFLPLWMRSIQDQATYETGYVKALVLCYAMPGKSAGIVSRIKSRTNYASRGDWLETNNYLLNDSVKYNGNYYTCIQKNSNVVPTNQEYWLENFNFKNINFTADRYLIDIIDGEIEDKYLAFPQRGEKLP